MNGRPSNVSTGGLILTPMLDWLQWHFQEGKHMAMEVSQAELPSSHPKYWEAVSIFFIFVFLNPITTALWVGSEKRISSCSLTLLMKFNP